jgi:hypothetical protein
MKMLSAILISISLWCSIQSQAQNLKLTGGIELTKGNIQRDVLLEIVQKKQEEIFNRLFANLIVNHFNNTEPGEGVSNFPTYYALYNMLNDLTVGKSKTTVSQALINDASELAYIYAFVLYYQSTEGGALLLNNIEQAEFVAVDNNKPKYNDNKLKLLNYYFDAAWVVLSDESVQSSFNFKRRVKSPEIEIWHDTHFKQVEKITNIPTTSGSTISFNGLVTAMQDALPDFTSTVADIGRVAALTKPRIGFSNLSLDEVNSIKTLLLQLGDVTDYLFRHNIVKNVLSLLVENLHVNNPNDVDLKQVYIDVESLILSLDKEFVSKNKRSSVASRLFFINPRPFLTIGTSNGFFLYSNRLGGKDDLGRQTSIHAINLAAEKIGVRVKLFDLNYTRSFGPGEVFEYHGTDRVWVRPQKKPTVSSLYYSIYGSGILYNLLDLKTDRNFDYGLLCGDVGLIFFNGLEFSVGIGLIYDRGFRSDHQMAKIDFSIPIVEYLSALKAKNKD